MLWSCTDLDEEYERGRGGTTHEHFSTPASPTELDEEYKRGGGGGETTQEQLPIPASPTERGEPIEEYFLIFYPLIPICIPNPYFYT